jgi:molybdenum cofactor cytidylyltransferase
MFGYNDLAIIILAAGNSSRMGTSKQLLEVDGQTLLNRTISCAMASNITNITVVLGANAEVYTKALKNKAVHVEINPDWNLGMGNTIKFAVKKLLNRFINVQGLLLLVCDQPLLSAAHINTMVDLFLKNTPPGVASRYKNTFGVPALFDRIAFADLLSIRDDSGAREVLNKLDSGLQLVSFEGGEIDLDTPDEYRQFINKAKSK